MTESVQNIQKKTLLDNSQCNKVNKDNLKNKGKHTFDGIGMCGVGVLVYFCQAFTPFTAATHYLKQTGDIIIFAHLFKDLHHR